MLGSAHGFMSLLLMNPNNYSVFFNATNGRLNWQGSLSMFFGTLLVGVGIALLGYFLGQAAPTGIKQNITSSVVDIILGSFFIIFGIKPFF